MLSCFVGTSLDACRLPLRYQSRFFNSRRRSQQYTITKSGEEDIYIGYGKVIRDDPKKYPSKEDAGFMRGATGGWAGGEPGLQKFIDTIEETELRAMQNDISKTRSSKNLGSGDDMIYVGFDYKNPGDLKAMREGKQGRFVVDDVSKYPGRDFMGWFPLQGGFAGGETGLQKFLEEGDIQISSVDGKGQSQMSPVLVGIFVAAVATTGGLVLTDIIDFGENFSLNVNNAQLDDNTRFLLEAAVGLLFSAWVGSVVFAFFRTAKEKLAAGASFLQKAGISVAFWVIVLYATYNLAKT